MSDTKNPVPPATLATLVTTLATQALHSMGVIEIPGAPKSEANLEIAKHLIDTVAVLEEKTKGNVTPEEAKLLEDALHQLRLAFVQVQKH
ncbi:MAG TPA: DUF1844 domain-containing protein [Pirellulaceae bacterium]|nr:DUF1844 domain-containing protein [Pirellulaceae bacterium]